MIGKNGCQDYSQIEGAEKKLVEQQQLFLVAARSIERRSLLITPAAGTTRNKKSCSNGL